MAAQPQIAKYRTACRTCGQLFLSAPLDIPIIGHADERLVRFVQKLAEHLQTHHPDLMQRVGLTIQDMTGFIILSLFTSEDPTLIGKAEMVRHGFHRMTRSSDITDGVILDRLARAGFTKEEIEKVGPVMRDMRDALTEQGQYAPQSAPRSNLVSL
jgi:hypothetical protein